MEQQPKPNLLNFFLYLGAVILVIAAAVFLFSDKNTTNTEEARPTDATNSAETNTMAYKTQPEMKIDQKKKYTALMETTQGPITLELFASENPVTVNNFVFLAREGFYNGTIFHRVIKDFMIQGGDPKGDGTGSPGYKFDDEKITRDYKRGIIAMANSGPNTNGSQFFIMHKDYDLPKNYVIFGQVIEGQDTVDKIAEAPTEDGGTGEQSKPTEPVRVEKITIKEE